MYARHISAAAMRYAAAGAIMPRCCYYFARRYLLFAAILHGRHYVAVYAMMICCRRMPPYERYGATYCFRYATAFHCCRDAFIADGFIDYAITLFDTRYITLMLSMRFVAIYALMSFAMRRCMPRRYMPLRYAFYAPLRRHAMLLRHTMPLFRYATMRAALHADYAIAA